MRLRPIVGQPGSSSIISRVKLGQTTVQLRKRAGFDDVGHRGAETVQERPLLSCKGETRLPDCGVVHQVGIDHRSRLSGFPPLTFDVGWSHDTP